MNDLDPRRPRPNVNARQTRQSALVAVLIASVACGGLIAFAQGGAKKSLTGAKASAAAAADTTTDTAIIASPPASDIASVGLDSESTTTIAAATDSSDVATTADANQDLDGNPELTAKAGCQLSEASVRLGAQGPSVTCLQNALISAGHYTGAATGTFDQATDVAARKMQTERDLFVDGVVGRESAISLGIWHDEASLVVRTPVPPAGAKDSMGFPLSTVSSTGSNAPPLPPNSGSGKRLVYDRAQQRVWAVSSDEVIIRSWLVSGSKYSNEIPGTHEVYSRSEVSTAWNGKALLPHMVRWLKTEIGNIGFHGIPIHRSDGTAYQTEAELGTRLSGGCQRQANRDADFVWAFAQIGTTVVVI